MIIYDIGCENGHRFEGWFSAADDYDAQVQHGRLNCPVCGSLEVRRVPSASRIRTRANEDPAPEITSSDLESVGKVANSINKLRSFIEQNFDDVGDRFPEEARKVYYGEAAARNLRGVAGPREVGELLEEGIAVVPLPIHIPSRKKLN